MPRRHPSRESNWLNTNPDHARRTNAPALNDQAIETTLEALVKPAVFAELEHYRRLGLRERLLTLPVMTALVLSLIWRRIPGVCTLQRMLARERLLWCEPMRVRQSSLSERFLTFPAELFEGVLLRVLEELPRRSAARKRPLPKPLSTVAACFAHLYAVDGTTLEALFRKLDTLRDKPEAPLAGHVVGVVDLVSHLPAKLFFEERANSNDKVLLPQVLEWLEAGTLLVFDLGYFSFSFFDSLTQRSCFFVTRMRNKTSYTVEAVLFSGPRLRETVVRLGKYRSNPSQHALRLIEVHIDGLWRRYLTNVLERERLSAAEVVALYERRWRIERVFLEVKRLLGLSYLWVGSLNGVCLQLYATFLFYAVLIDLCDEVAEASGVPLERVSVEMVYRSLYFYVQARSQGYASTAAKYLSDEAKELGILKRKRARLRPTAYAQAAAGEALRQ
jgi:hypothetical protein